MKYLIPIDFSEIALNALKYALQMTQPDDEITVIHVWQALLNTNEPMLITPASTHEEGLRMEIEEMVDEAGKNIQGERNVEIKLELGNAVHAIVKESEQEDYHSIIMGTRDKYDFIDKIFGTVSLGVVKKSSIPVYLVPKDCGFNVPKSVLVATDYHFESEKVIDNLLRWNEKHSAALKFFHVSTGKEEQSKFRHNLLSELLEKRNLPYSISLDQEHANDVTRSILEKVHKEKCDLLLVVADSQSWLDTVLKKNVSKDLILKTSVPVVFLHSQKRKPILKKIPIMEAIV